MEKIKRNIVIPGILFLVSGYLCSGIFAQNKYQFQPVTFDQVKITDGFWASRIKTNREVTIPYDFKKCEETGRIDNFAIAAGVKEGKFSGSRYNDSDVFKVIEGASYSLQQYYDSELDAYLDSIIVLIAGAQEDDGYLYTLRTIDPQNPQPRAGDQRWSLLSLSHELYNVGHLYEAAAAHFKATKKRNLLKVAIRNANLICNLFGPGKIRLVPGHQEIEIGLVKLFSVTGDKKYLDLVKFFVDERGNKKGHKLYGEYSQDDIPVIEQSKAVGHAVRAGYFYCGVAEVAAMTGNPDYIAAIDRIWADVVGTKLYLTGGVGVRGDDEAFGGSYILPNETAYNETCASIANAMWNYRMFLLHGESKYMDVFERILYNGFLSGVSLDGDEFFYANPLECRDSFPRQPWYKVSCCPTNIVRFLPSLSGYVYAKKEDSLYVNLFIGSTASIQLDEKEIEIRQETNYPWEGRIKLAIHSPTDLKFKLFIRIPGWARGQVVPADLYTYSDNKNISPVSIKVNNRKVSFRISNGYAVLEQTWKDNDEVILDIPMEPRRIVANEMVEADRDREAYQRGPLVYCFEGIDNNGNALNIAVSDKKKIQYTYMPELLHGVGVLHFKGVQLWKDESTHTVTSKSTRLMAIPYYAWAHRGIGTMAVWISDKTY